MGNREIRIGTRDGAATPDEPGMTTMPAPPRVEVDVHRKRPFDGLVVIDGARSSASALHGLAPNRIVTIDVIKGSRARQLYPGDSVAAKGVIKVTTKAP